MGENKRELIAIDMDGVIADTAANFILWYEQETGIRVARDVFNNKREADALPGNAVMKYVHTAGFFRSVPVMPGAQEAVKKLMERYEVYIVSAAMEFPQSLKEKYEWLQEHFPYIGWHNIVFCGDKSVISTDYMIDDHVKNLDVCKGKTLMFTAGHNLINNIHQRVDSWNEVLRFFESKG